MTGVGYRSKLRNSASATSKTLLLSKRSWTGMRSGKPVISSTFPILVALLWECIPDEDNRDRAAMDTYLSWSIEVMPFPLACTLMAR